MTPPFAEILQSHQFTFYVGPEKCPVTVHSAAIAGTSKPMDVLINGRMSEAETRCATLQEIEVDDFHRFCEFAYRGDYTVPSWTTDVSEPVPTGTSNDELGGIWGSALSTKKKGKKGKKTLTAELEPPPPTPPPPPPPEEEPDFGITDSITIEPEPPALPKFPKSELRTQLQSRKYIPRGSPLAQLEAGFSPVSNVHANQNFTPVFLAHARLYAFANVRLVDSLKALALHKLQKTLLDFKLYRKRVRDVIEVARYAYSNDHTPDRGSGELDSLRKLVVEYIASEIDIIGESAEFVDLIKEGGEFVEDFWGIARTYLIH